MHYQILVLGYKTNAIDWAPPKYIYTTVQLSRTLERVNQEGVHKVHYQILVLGVQNQGQSTGHPPNSYIPNFSSLGAK